MRFFPFGDGKKKTTDVNKPETVVSPMHYYHNLLKEPKKMSFESIESTQSLLSEDKIEIESVKSDITMNSSDLSDDLGSLETISLSSNNPIENQNTDEWDDLSIIKITP